MRPPIVTVGHEAPVSVPAGSGNVSIAMRHDSNMQLTAELMAVHPYVNGSIIMNRSFDNV